jgi:hypothetical protein
LSLMSLSNDERPAQSTCYVYILHVLLKKLPYGSFFLYNQ